MRRLAWMRLLADLRLSLCPRSGRELRSQVRGSCGLGWMVRERGSAARPVGQGHRCAARPVGLPSRPPGRAALMAGEAGSRAAGLTRRQRPRDRAVNRQPDPPGPREPRSGALDRPAARRYPRSRTIHPQPHMRPRTWLRNSHPDLGQRLNAGQPATHVQRHRATGWGAYCLEAIAARSRRREAPTLSIRPMAGHPTAASPALDRLVGAEDGALPVHGTGWIRYPGAKYFEYRRARPRAHRAAVR